MALNDVVRLLRTHPSIIVDEVHSATVCGALNLLQCDEDGWTLLHFASYIGHVPLVYYLLFVACVPVNIGPPTAWTPLAGAARHGHSCCVRMLLQAGANPEIQDSTGMLPIDYARMEEHTEVQEMLSMHPESSEFF